MHIGNSSPQANYLMSRADAHSDQQNDSGINDQNKSQNAGGNCAVSKSTGTNKLFDMPTFETMNSQLKAANGPHFADAPAPAKPTVHCNNTAVKQDNNYQENDISQIVELVQSFLNLFKALISLFGKTNGQIGNGQCDAKGDNQQETADSKPGNDKNCVQSPPKCNVPVTEPDCTQTTTEKTVEAKSGRVWGDPHFVGAEGGKYDVHGEPGKVYNILSDKGIQMNAKFDNPAGEPSVTYVYETGITLNGHQVHFDKDGTLTINGEKKDDGSHLGGAVVKQGNKITVNSGEYTIELSGNGRYTNYDFKSGNVNADGVMPHGLWGQTADGDGKARNGDSGKTGQGGGAIERLDGSITDKGDQTTFRSYETRGLFDTNFENFNKYL